MELRKREAAWVAVSDLWLDQPIQEKDLEYIAGVLRQSGLEKNDLEDLYHYEVAPVVYGNLLTVAGVWTGFNQEWLCSTIHKNLASWSTAKKLKYRLLRPVMTYGTNIYWRKILDKLTTES